MTAACSEANVAGLLSQLGRRTSWCSVLLHSDLAERSASEQIDARPLTGNQKNLISLVIIVNISEFFDMFLSGLLAGLASVFTPLGLLLGAQAQQWLAAPLGWRGLIALGALPVLLLIWLRQMPESPRFLQITGRNDEARSAYAWALQIPADQVGALPEIEATSKSSFGVVFRKYPKQLAIITLGSFSFILGSFTVQSWGQTLLKDGFGFEAAIVGGLFTIVSVADMFGRLGSAWLADRIGRRWVMLSFGLLGAVGCVIAALAQDPWLFFAGILIVMTFGDGAFGILNAFGSEQFPNEARSTGLGLGYGIGAMAKVVGPFLMSALIGGDAIQQNVTRDAVPPAFYLFAALLVIGGVLYTVRQGDPQRLPGEDLITEDHSCGVEHLRRW